MTKYESYIRRKQTEYGSKFDASDLAEQFVPFFNSGERVKVLFPYGETLTGSVGVTTGFRPIFLLMRTKRSIGSPWTLRQDDKIMSVQGVNGKYRELPGR